MKRIFSRHEEVKMIKNIFFTILLSLSISTNAFSASAFQKVNNDFSICGNFKDQDYLYEASRDEDTTFYKGQLGRMVTEVWVYRKTNRIRSFHARNDAELLYHEWRGILQKKYGKPTDDKSTYHGKQSLLDGAYKTAYSTNHIYWRGGSMELLETSASSSYDRYDRLIESSPDSTIFSSYCDESVYQAPAIKR